MSGREIGRNGTAGRGARPGRGRRRVTGSVLGILILGAVVVGYAVTLGPGHYARLHAEVTEQGLPVEVTGDLSVTPGAGWIAEPLVTDLVDWPPLPRLQDWSVLFGEETGVLLRSPDQRLRVELRSDGEDAPRGEVLTEILASGLTVRHVDTPSSILAVVDTASGPLSLRAEVEEGESIDAYRPTVSLLLESIGAG